MKNTYITVLLLASIIFTACNRDELLDIKPFGQEIPSTVEDFRLILDNSNDEFSPTDKGRIPMYDLDLFMSDEMKVPDGTLSQFVELGISRFANALTWEEHFAQPDEEDTDWSIMYNQILVANAVIEGVSEPEISGSAQEKAQLIAEAKVHRAFAHFSLVNLYAKQYDPETASTDLGVPIKTAAAFGNLERQPVQMVYDIVLQDLEQAIESNALPEQPSLIRHRPSMAGTYGVLAKVYLTMGNYSEALNAADNVLQRYDVLNDFNEFPPLPFSFENPELLLHKASPGLSPFTPHFVSDELLAMYDADDLRLNLIFQLNFDFETGEEDFVFFRDNFSTPKYMGPSVAEMFLIRAECNARLNNLSAVADDLNTVRSKRIAASAYTPLPEYTDASVALNDVKDERQRELAGQGVRLFDLKRYNLLDNANISLTRTIDGVTRTLEPNAPRWVAPIARKLIILNPEIVQNPR